MRWVSLLLGLSLVFPVQRSARALNVEDVITASLDRPLWALSLESAVWLTPVKSTNAPSFALMSFSAGTRGVPEEGVTRREDEIGRTTRALPLYLAERINIETPCGAVNYIPLLQGTGPLLAGERTKGKDLASVFSGRHRYLITGHFEKDYLTLRNKLSIYLYDVQTDKEVVLSQATSLFNSPPDIAVRAAEGVFEEIRKAKICSFMTPPKRFARPPEVYTKAYLDGLGQLLMQTLVQNGYVPKSSLWGEANVLNWYLSLTRTMPGSSIPRLMYIRGVLASHGYGTEAYKPHIGPLTEILTSLDDPGDPVNRVSPLFFQQIGRHDLFDAKLSAFENVSDQGFQAWIKTLADKE